MNDEVRRNPLQVRRLGLVQIWQHSSAVNDVVRLTIPNTNNLELLEHAVGEGISFAVLPKFISGVVGGLSWPPTTLAEFLVVVRVSL